MGQTAIASPTKKFFIDMLTRDISLEDTILDMVDNSIDSLCRYENIDVSESILVKNNKAQLTKIRYFVDISMSENEFVIIDNCGGIDKKQAQNDVFRFGKVAHSEEATLSVYGIGLKRAMFKIGKEITVESYTKEDSYRVLINVDDWLSDEKEGKVTKIDWSFPLEDIKRPHNQKNGTKITIRNLNKEVKMRIHDGAIDSRLQSYIATTYTLFLSKYVNVSINNNIIEPDLIPIGKSQDVSPGYATLTHNDVKVMILAGLAERFEGKYIGEKAGWYVLCNGRIVVSADKTDLTGWGVESAQYQPQYRGFLGVLFFFSKNPENLPWTTTKRGLNRESYVFQLAKNKMRDVAAPVLMFLRSMYQSDQQEQPVQRSIADSVKSIDLKSMIPTAEAVFKVEQNLSPRQRNTVKVQYDAKKSDIEIIRRCIKRSNLPAGQVGKYTFDYFLKQECTND